MLSTLRNKIPIQRHRSIRSQLLLLVLAVAVPLLGLVIYTTVTQARYEAEQARASALTLAQLESTDVEQFLAEAEGLLAELAQRPLVQAVNPALCDPFLRELPSLFPRFVGLGVVDASGQQICSSILSSQSLLPSVADRGWFQAVKLNKTFTVSEAQVGRNTGRWVSILSYPILDENGRFKGALGLPIDLIQFQTELDRVHLPPRTTITILDAHGTVVARSLDSDLWVGQNVRRSAIVDIMFSQQEGQFQGRGLDDEERLYGFTTIPRANWRVYVGIPTRVAFASVRTLLIRQSVLALAVVVLISILASYLRRQIEHPMHELSQVAEAVAAGRLDQRAPVMGPREFAEVAVQFNHMLDVREQHTAQLERHSRQLDTLGRLGQAVASSLELPVLLDRVLEHVALLVPAEATSIWLWEQDELCCAAASGSLVASCDSGRSLPTTDDLFAQVIRKGQSVFVRDVAEQDGLEQTGQDSGCREDVPRENVLQNSVIREMAAQNGASVRTIQAVPLILNGSVIGLLLAVHSRPGALGSIDLQMLEAAASWAAIAIGNARQHEKLRHLAQQVISAQEEERKRLAQELHDETGQALIALKYRLTMLQDDLMAHSGDRATEGLPQHIQAAMDLTDNTMQQLRLLSHGLRPPTLSHLGLNAALETFCRDFATHPGLIINYHGHTLPSLPEEIGISFYRFLQEALTNIAKHAEASNVDVTLTYDSEHLALQVTDDGKGFDLPAKLASSRHSGIGLLGMQERFRQLGGECRIQSAPGEGTSLLARCPVTSDPISSTNADQVQV